MSTIRNMCHVFLIINYFSRTTILQAMHFEQDNLGQIENFLKKLFHHNKTT